MTGAPTVDGPLRVVPVQATSQSGLVGAVWAGSCRVQLALSTPKVRLAASQAQAVPERRRRSPPRSGWPARLGPMAAPRRNRWGHYYRGAGLRELGPEWPFFYVECTFCTERLVGSGLSVYSNCTLDDPRHVVRVLGGTWATRGGSRIRCPWCSVAQYGGDPSWIPATAEQCSLWVCANSAQFTARLGYLSPWHPPPPDWPPPPERGRPNPQPPPPRVPDMRSPPRSG